MKIYKVNISYPNGKETAEYKNRADAIKHVVDAYRLDYQWVFAKVAPSEEVDQFNCEVIENSTVSKNDVVYSIQETELQQLEGEDSLKKVEDTLSSAAKDMYEALSEAVEKYGKPGGPWNVPGEPGSWIYKAKKALAKAGGES